MTAKNIWKISTKFGDDVGEAEISVHIWLIVRSYNAAAASLNGVQLNSELTIPAEYTNLGFLGVRQHRMSCSLSMQFNHKTLLQMNFQFLKLLTNALVLSNE